MNIGARLARIEAKFNPVLDVASCWVFFRDPSDQQRSRDIDNSYSDGTVHHLSIRSDKPRPFPPDLLILLYKNGIDPDPRPGGPDVEPRAGEDPAPDDDEPTGDLDPETQQWVRDELRPCLTAAQARIVDQARYVVILS